MGLDRELLKLYQKCSNLAFKWILNGFGKQNTIKARKNWEEVAWLNLGDTGSTRMVRMLETSIIISIWKKPGQWVLGGNVWGPFRLSIIKIFSLLYLRYVVMCCNNSFTWIRPSGSVCPSWGANGPHPTQHLEWFWSF